MKKIIVITGLLFVIVAVCGASAKAGRTHDEIVKQANEELQKICMPMQPFMDRPDNLKKVEVIDESEVNAFADDSGRVAFYMGMINFAQSRDEAAMVCGHEMAHLSREHLKKSLGSSILATVVSSAIGGVAGDLAGNLIYGKNSRKHERESDREGLRYAWNAGFDPYAAAELWEGMYMLGGEMPLGKYLSTHPVDTERVENFRVLLVRFCRDGLATTYCDEILADKDLETLYNQFESRGK